MVAPVVLAFCGMAALQALGAGYSAKQQAQAEKFRLQQDALNKKYASETAKINASIEAANIVSQQKAVEMQGLMQTMQDGQAMAAEKASQASSGVYLNSASKHEIRASQFLSHQINLNNIESNRVSALTTGRSKIAEQQANALTGAASSYASSIISSSIDPNKAFGLAGLTSLAGSAGQYFAMTGFSAGGNEIIGGAENGGLAR